MTQISIPIQLKNINGQNLVGSGNIEVVESTTDINKVYGTDASGNPKKYSYPSDFGGGGSGDIEVDDTVVVNGTTGRIFYVKSDATVGETDELFWDATNSRLGLNNSSPGAQIDVTAKGSLSSDVMARFGSVLEVRGDSVVNFPSSGVRLAFHEGNAGEIGIHKKSYQNGYFGFYSKRSYYGFTNSYPVPDNLINNQLYIELDDTTETSIIGRGGNTFYGTLKFKTANRGSFNFDDLFEATKFYKGQPISKLWFKHSLTFEEDCHIEFEDNGGCIGSDDSQKFAFWGATPIAQPTLSTGAGHTVDDVITLLQTLGLCKQ